MPNWNEVLIELKKEAEESPTDRIRRKYLKRLSKKTKRNTIAYYSGWLQKPNQPSVAVNDSDMNGFMTVIHQMDKSKGLDLLLHTPGGDLAATESIVEYLRKMFGTDIRVIVPHLAMSAGTMIACSGKEILMGKHSNLGPIDPQFRGISAEGVLEEFERAKREVKADQSTIPVWQVILSKYHPTFIGDCEKAIRWSKELAKKWLETGMFQGQADAQNKIDSVMKMLASHQETSSHARHISAEKCKEIGLNVKMLEDGDKGFQDLILTVHHAFFHTFASSNVTKIIENHNGRAMVIYHA
ncbi:MAG TPA: ATP-dependent Clp protease proteolytic subunit [Atribacter sp.]|uniref:SDH family Clp fold serine proteinase n=1 Tax=Atribacter sp. TaxID=2847780 RepID=UPI002B8B29A5|nr:ATP-dependent Clp protease proteolytic subunit [Atribacter sp.]HQK84169.1 ATP-dependent Clp protease proteolytic subunit [Atribacter sp.]